MANFSTAILTSAAGNFDYFAQGILSLPLMKQFKARAQMRIAGSCRTSPPATTGRAEGPRSPKLGGIMKKHGYSPDRQLAIEVATRNTSASRDLPMPLIDQLKRSTATQR
jgi:hypothetical protein